METYMKPSKLKDYVTNEVYIEGHTKYDIDALIDYIIKDATDDEYIQIQKPEDDRIAFTRYADVFTKVEMTPWGFSARVSRNSGILSIDLETSDSVDDFLDKVIAVQEIVAS